MRVILLKDVAKIGRRFEITEVPDGYALNKLIPQKMAEPATPNNLKKVKSMQAKQDSLKATDDANFDKVVEALFDKTITISAKANSEGGLFQAIKPSDIADKLSDVAGVGVLADLVQISDPIKHVGEWSITLALGEKTAPIKLVIEAE
ncbi:50S ribosomal protein L9 [Candidatus Kaiserbacteria bacterium]|nr:50S ribosomal protein L9 [Candidatus Kaiserbacteria bacterium]